ncbi:MAG: glutathione S-transferase C-terminal domain-containing protein, partial [Rhodospirillales bacterium]
PTRYEEDTDPLHHRAEGVRFLAGLEDRLTRSAFLSGDRMSLADAAIAPFVRQFAHVDKDWFDGLDLPKVRGWLEVFLESAIFASVMQKYPAWRSGEKEPLFPVKLPEPAGSIKPQPVRSE